MIENNLTKNKPWTSIRLASPEAQQSPFLGFKQNGSCRYKVDENNQLNL
jgi:hypothetical protein